MDKRIRLESGRLNRPGGSNPSRSAMKRQNLNSCFDFLVLLTFFVVVGTSIYGKSIVGEYGRLDDYTLVVQSVNGSHHFKDVFFHSGRILPSIIGDFLFSRVNSVSNLAYLRGLCVFVLATTSALVALFVKNLFKSRMYSLQILPSLLIGSCIFITPSSANAATWAVQCVLHLSLTLGLSGGILIATKNQYKNRWNNVIGCLLIASAAFTYQHYVMIALLPVLFRLAHTWFTSKIFEYTKAMLICIFCGLALLSNFAFLRIIRSESSGRAFGSPISEHITWFFTTFIPRSINIGVPDSNSNRYFSMGLLLLGLISPLIINRRFWPLPLLIVGAWFMSAIVVLPTEMWASYRLLYPSQIILWSGIVFGLVLGFQELPKRSNAIGISTMIILIVIFSASSGISAYRFMAQPNIVDWASVRCALETRIPNAPIDALVVTDMNDSTSSFVSYDEYGVIGSSVDWVLPMMYRLTPLATKRESLGFPVPPVFPKWAAVGQEGTWIEFQQTKCLTQ